MTFIKSVTKGNSLNKAQVIFNYIILYKDNLSLILTVGNAIRFFKFDVNTDPNKTKFKW